MINKKYIVIDFDLTIFKSNFPHVGSPMPYAKEVINELYMRKDCVVVINTCRSGKYEGMAENALKEYGINYDWLNCNPPELIESFGQDCRKLSAHNGVYIDDKCLMGLPETDDGLVDWLKIKEIIYKRLKLN